MVLTRENIFDQFLYLRTKYGKSQKQIAKDTCVSSATLSAIETGKKKGVKMRSDVIFKLNQYFEKLGE